MTIRVHVACNDNEQRAAIANFLSGESDMDVVATSSEDYVGAAAVELTHPDVVVLGLPAHDDVAAHAPKYRGIMRSSAAIVAFCATPAQAADYLELGITRVVSSGGPTTTLCDAVRAACGGADAEVAPAE